MKKAILITAMSMGTMVFSQVKEYKKYVFKDSVTLEKGIQLPYITEKSISGDSIRIPILDENNRIHGWVNKDSISVAVLSNYVETSDIIDDDTMATASSSTISTSGSVRNYVDNNLANKLSTTGTAADSDKVDGIHASQLLRSDANDATNPGVKTWFGGAIIGQEASSAIMQINGLLRTGNIYVHEGGATPTTNAGIISNDGGSLEWNGDTIFHDGNDGPGSGLSADKVDNYDSASSATAWTVAVRNNVAALTASAFNISSDSRLKTNIQDYEVKPISISWKTFDFNNGLANQLGVLAQDLLVNHPEFVDVGVDGYYFVNYIALLIAKMAELEDRVKSLELSVANILANQN